TRGEFLGFGAALAGAYSVGRRPGLTAQSGAPNVATTADFVVVNAKVYTSDVSQPRAEAFAVRDGRFVAVGSSADVRNLATAKTQVIDAGGMTVTAGFIDTHCHPSGIEELYGVNTNVRTVAQLLDAVHKKAQATAPGVWVTGFMFDDTKLDRALTRHDLDEA